MCNHVGAVLILIEDAQRTSGAKKIPIKIQSEIKFIKRNDMPVMVLDLIRVLEAFNKCMYIHPEPLSASSFEEVSQQAVAKKRKASEEQPKPRKKPKKAIEFECKNCNKVISRTNMLEHVLECSKKSGGPGGSEDRYIVMITDSDRSDFFLVVDTTGSTTLKALEEGVGPEWWDCGCGHLSKFSVRKTMKMRDLATEGGYCGYTFDMGSTTSLSFRIVGQYTTNKKMPKMSIVGQNTMPSMTCNECNGEAEVYCSQCETNGRFMGTGCMCIEHAEKIHPDKCSNELEDILITNEDVKKVVNSPRFLSCGWR